MTAEEIKDRPLIRFTVATLAVLAALVIGIIGICALKGIALEGHELYILAGVLVGHLAGFLGSLKSPPAEKS